MRKVYLKSIHTDKEGAFATIEIKGIDGTLANVYGTDPAEAINRARELIATINIGSAFLRERLSARFVV